MSGLLNSPVVDMVDEEDVSGSDARTLRSKAARRSNLSRRLSDISCGCLADDRMRVSGARVALSSSRHKSYERLSSSLLVKSTINGPEASPHPKETTRKAGQVADRRQTMEWYEVQKIQFDRGGYGVHTCIDLGDGYRYSVGGLNTTFAGLE